MDKVSHFFRAFFRGIARAFNSQGHNIKTYVSYGILYDVMFNLSRPYAPKFAERLGGSEFHISLITSLPGFFAVIALIPGSVLLTKFKNKQKITAFLFAVSRSFLVLMALTPFLAPEYRAWAFVIVLAAMNFPDSVSQASLQSFLGDLFPPRQRADAIAIRSKFGNLATAAALIISSIVLGFAGAENEQKIRVYQVFYLVAFLFGVFEVYVFLRLRPKKSKAVLHPFDIKSFPKIVKDKRFITFCFVLFAFHFSYFMGFPLANIILIKTLGANEFWVGISTFTNVSAIVASSKFWGRMLKKRGTGTVLALSSAGLALNIMLISIAPSTLFYVFTAFFGGWFTCGVNLGVLNGLLESTPDMDRVVYVGVFQTFVNLTLAVAPLFSHLVSVNTDIYFAIYVTGAARLLCGAMIYLIYRRKMLAA